MLERVLQSELLRQAEGRIAPGRTLTLTGVWGSSATLIAAALGRLRNAPVLVVVPHLDDADAAVDDLDVFLKRSSGPARVFPAWEAQLATDHVSHEVTGERLRLLNLLSDPAAADEAVDYVVAPVLAMLQPVPTPEALAAGRLRLSRGEAISPEQFRAWLLDAGYEHVEQVDQQGEFAHRGGIVDVFPPAEPLAVRVEFFGDELESIRTFDLDTQRSRDELHAYDLTAMTIGESLDRLAGQPAADLTRRMTHLLDYLPSETVVFLHQPRDIRQLAEQLYDRIRDDLAEEASPVALRGVEEVFSAMDRFACVHSQPFSGAAEPEAMSMGVRSLQRLAINTTEALAELEDLAQAADVWVYCQTPAERERFEQTIREHHPRLGPSLHLGEGHVTAGSIGRRCDWSSWAMRSCIIASPKPGAFGASAPADRSKACSTCTRATGWCTWGTVLRSSTACGGWSATARRKNTFACASPATPCCTSRPGKFNSCRNTSARKAGARASASWAVSTGREPSSARPRRCKT